LNRYDAKNTKKNIEIYANQLLKDVLGVFWAPAVFFFSILLKQKGGSPHTPPSHLM
jgi:hypothetical protein